MTVPLVESFNSAPASKRVAEPYGLEDRYLGTGESFDSPHDPAIERLSHATDVKKPPMAGIRLDSGLLNPFVRATLTTTKD